MDENFTYLDENGVKVQGEFLYETTIDGKMYALCNLHYGADDNTICACKIIEDGDQRVFAKLDQTDNVDAIMAELNQMFMGE